ncbi:Biotin-lipoyl like [Parasphingorhabdus marina DSM 22363]|uniref:Biotin-lipoyl like n=1 Tax=Parasphingorhabdus marina DSM 22363 TaxID=1123272 RepID=A0A1N6DG31_9SPHN|nr:HlyD family efflux transporter periplasmic adaptor subunit [Parasphingorhabdus marina]SIN69614.1 Biotin-lipoyl like [Parasphingorhabdus marina DSM 22363]
MYRQRVIGGLILLGAILIAALLYLFRSTPEGKPPEELVPLVQVAPIEIRSGNLMVSGSGTVRARDEVTLAAEVAGKLVYVNPRLREGQSVAKGTVLFRIDDSDYRNAVQTAQADVASQNVALLQAQEEVTLAKEELARFAERSADSTAYAGVDDNDFAARILPPAELAGGPETGQTRPQTPNGLATREPQLQSARAGLRRARAQLSNAQIALQRTTVRAPFSGVVRSENIAVGSYVAPGQSLGQMVGTSQLEASIPLSEKDAALIPALWRQGGGAPIEASVFSTYGGTRYRWQAFVDRASSVLNPQTRTIDVFLRVPNPLRGGAPAADQKDGEPETTAASAPPLFVGTFVEAEITGKALDAYAVLPLSALRPGNKVWLVRDGKLRIVDVDLLQRTDSQVLVSTRGLGSSPIAVVGALKAATDGQKVRIADARKPSAKQGPDKAEPKPSAAGNASGKKASTTP